MEVVPQQYVLDSMRLFAEEVMPRFKNDAESGPLSPAGVRLMPLAGSLDIRPLLARTRPTVELDDRELHFDDVDILQVLYEIGSRTSKRSCRPP